MSTKKLIAVIEDDAAIRRGIVDCLQFEGYVTREASNGADGLKLALTAPCDLVLLDLVMPVMNGLDVLAEIRRTQPTLPVIVLTALGQETDRVKGLRLGADDYVVKPFSVKELLARVEAVLRRSPQRPKKVKEISLPGGTADLERQEVRFANGQQTKLSERETELLRYLAANAGRCITRDELLSHVWHVDPKGVTTRTIDMQVARLREKIGDTNGEHVIRTVRGKGYMFETQAKG